VLCQPGFYCTGGVRYMCDPGTYSLPAGGSTTQGCDGPCSAGYFCPPFSSSPTQFACGSAAVYCPSLSSAPLNVSEGYYSIGGLTAATSTDESVCGSGYYCTAGVRFSCPPGRFGAVSGGVNLTMGCPYICPAGYYCPLASVIGTALPCGDPRNYCPSGAGAPTVTPTGYYAVAVQDGGTPIYSSVLPCAPGTYCFGGSWYPCPAGSYGNIGRISSPTCTAKVWLVVATTACVLLSMSIKSLYEFASVPISVSVCVPVHLHSCASAVVSVPVLLLVCVCVCVCAKLFCCVRVVSLCLSQAQWCTAEMWCVS
jgi:hypothetical protein